MTPGYRLSLGRTEEQRRTEDIVALVKHGDDSGLVVVRDLGSSTGDGVQGTVNKGVKLILQKGADSTLA